MSDPDPPQPLDYQTPVPGRNRWWWILAVIAAVVAIGLAVAFAGTPRLIMHGREISNDEMCVANMHQIGLAIQLYASDHNEDYPASLEDLIQKGLAPKTFICPESSDQASTGATTQEIASDFRKPGHLSYLYIGQGLTTNSATSDIIVMYEPLTNHHGNGINIVFGDGHTEFFTAAQSKIILAKIATGVRPVKISALPH